ncbi:7-methylguanosine phosphate-specific 5'-nucleotidase isoform X2 [Thrips palmi]|nr:7-methylguanosine phosphate-specific 5'-nucleotidase isoform X2 [Thrips palmi]XP_034246217.1 7-methylguanosine phosphate-specific 5'-nucleotidase isoform X2 [Thrips palmi]
MDTLIKLIPELGREYVHIKCPSKVVSILGKFAAGGVNALQVIADFDHTVTKQHIHGERHVSSFCVVNKCTVLPEDFRDKDRKLLEKYLPIERDPNLSKEEKIPYMVEWYTTTSELLNGFPLGSDEIASAVKKSDTQLRTGTAELVNALDEEDVPMLIFSAGLGDVVDAILKCHGVVNKNIHVISNFLKYKDGHVNGFTNDIVHPFNKNGKAAEHTKYFELMSSRHNVILMGDNLGDAEMADGVPNTDAVLKIGFLYGAVSTLLPSYMDHFDIVLVDDQTMVIPNSIFNHVKKN